MLRFLPLAFLFFTSASVLAQTPAAPSFQVPALTGPVVDEAGVLDQESAMQIESGLRKLHEGGGTQINVLTVRSLGGLAIEQASIKVTDAWKLGAKKTDNGVLLLIAPQERKVRIEVGQGLEGSLTDAMSNRIIRDTILPEFRNGSFGTGALAGVIEIVKRTDPNVDPTSLFTYSAPHRAGRRGQDGGGSVFKLIFFIIILLFIFGRRGGGGGRRISPWTSGLLGYGLGRGLGGGGGSSWGGGGGFGGGRGGGWSGGGGGFSGGGASGGW